MIHDPDFETLYEGLADIYRTLFDNVQTEMTRVLAVADDLRRHDGEMAGTPDTLHRLAKILDAAAAELGVYRKPAADA